MDEVTVEKLIQEFKSNGELDCEDSALFMLKKVASIRAISREP